MGARTTANGELWWGGSGGNSSAHPISTGGLNAGLRFCEQRFDIALDPSQPTMVTQCTKYTPGLTLGGRGHLVISGRGRATHPEWSSNVMSRACVIQLISLIKGGQLKIRRRYLTKIAVQPNPTTPFTMSTPVEDIPATSKALVQEVRNTHLGY